MSCCFPSSVPGSRRRHRAAAGTRRVVWAVQSGDNPFGCGQERGRYFGGGSAKPSCKERERCHQFLVALFSFNCCFTAGQQQVWRNQWLSPGGPEEWGWDRLCCKGHSHSGKLVLQFLLSNREKHNFQRGPGVHRAHEHTVGTCHCEGTVLRGMVHSSLVSRCMSCRDFLDLGYQGG